jgi:hypothetical protein
MVGLLLIEKMIDPDLLFQIFTPRFIMNLSESAENLVMDTR